MDDSQNTPIPDKTCPSCGGALDGAAGNLCPRCLMAKAMQPTVEEGAEVAAAPPLEDVAAAFPDLEVLKLIGRGGMGAVFKARQKSLDRHVALKILPQTLAGDPAFQRHFESEAKALAALGHPNIVMIHDFGHQGGFCYLLMEFVDGVNLRELLSTRKLSPDEALSIVPQLCEALEFAHGRGIVHRDIKPENLLLDRDGRVKVADFGIAKIVGAVGREGDRIAGTPAYMAPEQSATPTKVDGRADIYSLGVVFYEMLTGERPGGALEAPSQKVAIDLRLDEVVLRALESQPEMRWQTAAELRTQIDTISSTPARTAPAPIPGEGAPVLGGGERDRRTSLIGSLSFFMLLLGGFGLLFSMFTDMPHGGKHKSPWEPFAIHGSLLGGALLLGATWLWRLRGTVGSRSAWAFALTSLSLQLPLMMTMLFTARTVDTHLPHSSEVMRLESQVAEIDAKSDPTEVTRLHAEIESLRTQQFEESMQQMQSNTMRARVIAIAFLGIGLVGAIFGCALGWRHLAWLRETGPPRVGSFHAMFSALFWPMLIAFSVVFSLVLHPLNKGDTSELGAVLGLVAGVVTVVWISLKVWRWTKNEDGAGFPLREFAGAAIVLGGIILTLHLLTDAQSKHKALTVRLDDSLTIARQQALQANTEHFRAEAELDAILVNRPSAPDTNDDELQQFETQRRTAVDKVVLWKNRMMSREAERDLLAEQRLQAGPWWNKAIIPIVIGLAMVLGGIALMRSQRSH